jgi:imidazolonepropionase-like amidohydrolase
MTTRLSVALACVIAVAAHGRALERAPAGQRAVGSPAAQNAREPSTVIVVEGATLIDGNGGVPRPNAAIVIEGVRIVAVGTRGSMAYPAGARIINATGLTALPGLIDAHIHSLDFFPPLFLPFGVTTVYDTANPTDWVIAQREALKKGRIRGPRMFVTGVVIDGPDEGADRRDGYRVHVHNPDEARMMARDLLRRGVDALKVYEHLTPELLKAIVDEAHAAGTEAVGHSHDARDATLAGLKYIEHSTPIAHATLGDPAKIQAMDEGRLRTPEADMNPALFGPLIDLMVRNGVYFNPTLTRVWIAALPKRAAWYADATTLLEDPAYRFIPAARRGVWLQTAKAGHRDVEPRTLEAVRKVQEFTRRYVQAGGRIITGPDSGPSSGPANMAGLAMHVEMEALVDAGLTPMQAIQASTRWPAELLRKDADLGTVAPGRVADLVLIEGDPLADIRTTRKIRMVMKEGQLVDTTIDSAFTNPIPRPVAEYEMDSRAPALETLTPLVTRQGAANVRIEVTGSNFTRQSIVRFDTMNLPTRFVSTSTLTATVTRLPKDPGTYAVTVVNPGPAGGVSGQLYFLVDFRE